MFRIAGAIQLQRNVVFEHFEIVWNVIFEYFEMAQNLIRTWLDLKAYDYCAINAHF